MLKRLKNTGTNFLVLGIAIVIFVIAFLALNGLAAAQRPPTATVLVAVADMPIGHVVAPSDLAEKTVYQDETTGLFVPAAEANSVVGQIIGSPLFAGQPIPRSVIIGKVSETYRLSSALAAYPDYTLFPLPLDAMNIVAPEIESFYPGDLINITAVIASRPTHPDDFNTGFGLGQVVPSENGTTANKSPGESDGILKDTYPPLAKDLFPQGVRVLAVQGLPPEANTSSGNGDAGTSAPVLAVADTKPMLLLLIPNSQREKLALALQDSDMLIVSLIPHGIDTPTNGFTYWDLESLFQTDRSKNLGIPLESTSAQIPSDGTAAAPYPITSTQVISSTNTGQ